MVDLEKLADELIAEFEAEKIWAKTLMADGVREFYRRIVASAEKNQAKHE